MIVADNVLTETQKQKLFDFLNMWIDWLVDVLYTVLVQFIDIVTSKWFLGAFSVILIVLVLFSYLKKRLP